MFLITRKGPNRLDIDVSGKLDHAEMKRLLDELIAKSTDIEHGRMLYRINDFDFPTFRAIAVEISYIPELFRLIRKFDRAAVVSDTDWIRKAGEIEGAMIPGLKIKAFDDDDESDAVAWLER